MHKTITTAAAVVALGLLAACSADPKKLNPTPAGVSYSYEDTDDLNKVTDKATHFCAERGSTAKLRNISKNGDEKIAMFDCV